MILFKLVADSASQGMGKGPFSKDNSVLHIS